MGAIPVPAPIKSNLGKVCTECDGQDINPCTALYSCCANVEVLYKRLLTYTRGNKNEVDKLLLDYCWCRDEDSDGTDDCTFSICYVVIVL